MTRDEFLQQVRHIARQCGTTPLELLAETLMEQHRQVSPGFMREKLREAAAPHSADSPDQILFSGEEVDGIDRETQPTHSDR